MWNLCPLLLLSFLSAEAFIAPVGNSFRRSTATVDAQQHNDIDDSEMSRRRLFDLAGKGLAGTILGGAVQLAAPVRAEAPKTILLTGGNSGVGYQAVKRLASQGHKLVLPCRSMKKALDTVTSIKDVVPGADLIPAECNLASLSSILAFSKELPTLVGSDKKLDTVCYNAGLARLVGGELERTEDGFETTVGTNHLGHFYLNHLLMPSIKPSGRIVVTASSVHDPDGPGGAQGEKATLGNLEGFERDGKMFEMVDGQPFNADKAYKDSKLCNVFFTRELQRRLSAAKSDISVNCFTPGLIVSTGLFREQPKLFTTVFDMAATNVLKVGESQEWGGACLEYATTFDTKGIFYSSPPGSSKDGLDAVPEKLKPTEPSKESHDTAKGIRLWDLSEKLVGIA